MLRSASRGSARCSGEGKREAGSLLSCSKNLGETTSSVGLAGRVGGSLIAALSPGETERLGKSSAADSLGRLDPSLPSAWSPLSRVRDVNGPLLSVLSFRMILWPPLNRGSFGSRSDGTGSAFWTWSNREPPLEGARSLPVGVLRPLLGVEGRLPEAVGNGGKAQSRFADNSGLGGRGSYSRGAGAVMLRP